MESMETPAKRADVSQRQLDDRILVVKCDSTNKVLDSRSDAITPTTTTTKVQPIKIVIPVTGVVTLSGPTTINSPPKMIISPVHLSTQPTVSVKVGTNQLMSVKMVTNASLIQNSLTSSPPAVMNGVSDVANTSQKPVVSPDISAGSPLTNLPLTDDTQAKMTREQKQLQASINSSMVLSQMVTAGSTTRKSRGRKKKSQSPKAPQTDTTTNNIPRSKSMDVLNKGPRTRSRSRSQGQMTEDLNSENDGSTPKRHNMRSANADFAQKQKSFMKEIIKTQDSEEESAAKSDEETHSLKGTATKNVTVHIESLPQAPKVRTFYILFLSTFLTRDHLPPNRRAGLVFVGVVIKVVFLELNSFLAQISNVNAHFTRDACQNNNNPQISGRVPNVKKLKQRRQSTVENRSLRRILSVSY